MRIGKEHASTVFLFIMVTLMVLAMTVVLSIANGALEAGFWRVWPRQFAIAWPVAMPVAIAARYAAHKLVGRLTL